MPCVEEKQLRRDQRVSWANFFMVRLLSSFGFEELHRGQSVSWANFFMSGSCLS
jgi:hypothetical protein